LEDIIGQFTNIEKYQYLKSDSGWALLDFKWNSHHNAGDHLAFQITKEQINSKNNQIDNFDISLILSMFLRGYSFAVVPGDKKVFDASNQYVLAMDKIITFMSYFGGVFKITELVRTGNKPPPSSLSSIDTYVDFVNEIIDSLAALQRKQIAYREFSTNTQYIIPVLEEFVNTWWSLFIY